MSTISIAIQRLFPLLGIVFFVSCSPNTDFESTFLNDDDMDADTSMEQTDDWANTTRILFKEEILAYFDFLITNEQVIVGQQCGDAPNSTASFYTTYVDQLVDETGRHVGLIGTDFGWVSGDDYPVTLIDHWRNGGLVTVSWHADNPFVDGV